MQLTKTIFPDSAIFIEKKRVENRLWRKSEFLWRKKIKTSDIRTRAPEQLDTPFMAISTSSLKQLDNLDIRTVYLVKTKDQATGPPHKSSKASGHSSYGYLHKFTQATGQFGHQHKSPSLKQEPTWQATGHPPVSTRDSKQQDTP